ncbi:hypothetical protein EV363DRAFT_1169016 [Boletus edulis]|nr:hypothetical protein EV363DRAFT_1169016 [Boletus edulis]
MRRADGSVELHHVDGDLNEVNPRGPTTDPGLVNRGRLTMLCPRVVEKVEELCQEIAHVEWIPCDQVHHTASGSRNAVRSDVGVSLGGICRMNTCRYASGKFPPIDRVLW